MPSQAQHRNHRAGFSAVTVSITPTGLWVKSSALRHVTKSGVQTLCLDLIPSMIRPDGRVLRNRRTISKKKKKRGFQLFCPTNKSCLCKASGRNMIAWQDKTVQASWCKPATEQRNFWYLAKKICTLFFGSLKSRYSGCGSGEENKCLWFRFFASKPAAKPPPSKCLFFTQDLLCCLGKQNVCTPQVTGTSGVWSPFFTFPY